MHTPQAERHAITSRNHHLHAKPSLNKERLRGEGGIWRGIHEIGSDLKKKSKHLNSIGQKDRVPMHRADA